jgi:hypothetical protein
MSKSPAARRISDDMSGAEHPGKAPGAPTPTAQDLLDAGRRDAPARDDEERVWSALCRRFMRSSARRHLSATILSIIVT